MPSEYEMSIEEEINQVNVTRPHIVILGAGASRACCSRGDKNGAILPLMDDLIEVVGLISDFDQWGIDPMQNFENIYNDLYEKNEEEKLNKIQNKIFNYFNRLELPDHPTIYDHLVLSLRDKDIIATFNWDPLLMQAYRRNKDSGLTLPNLAFLHGNVSVGYCPDHKYARVANSECKHCNRILSPVDLLYPIKTKNYASNLYIEHQWKILKYGFKNAFMITLFGYSAPKTDKEAINAMKEAWGNKYQRNMEQTAFITIENEDNVHHAWEDFVHTHHYEIHDNFYNSWIANHPRRTGEAWKNQYFDIKFFDPNPIPKDLSFVNLWVWFRRFKKPERK